MKDLLKFQASWCGPCKSLSKVMEGVDLGVRVKEIDIDEDTAMTVKYQIRNVPTLVLLDENGKETKRMSGAKSLNDLKTWLES